VQPIKITEDSLADLAAQLPELRFLSEIDCEWSTTSLAQSYLDYYGINFSREFDGISHGFGYIDAANFRIATHYWLPKKAKATLLVLHGYYDHVGLYANVFRFALSHNLAVITFDLPGHGLSSGERASIESFDQYADVLAVILKKSKPLLPHPFHVMTQSTGGAVLLNYLWRYEQKHGLAERFEKIVLCAPLLLPRDWKLGRYAYAIARHFIHRLKRGPTTSSHDQAFIRFITHEDCLQAKFLSLKWVGAMKAWDQQFNRFTPLEKEVLVIQGTADMTVDWRYNLSQIQKKLPRTKVCMIADAGHQLVNESEIFRTQVFAAAIQHLSL
jgi:alpha-beta hydrolase superfamily lysophospholipase